MRHPLYRAFALLFAATLPAFAADGVIEINQAKALAGGVTPGDLPGFPVTITLPGSYRLTSNLDVRFLAAAAADTPIVFIGERFVELDLNGFSLIGPASCDASGCIGAGKGVGIQAIDATIRNGYVTGAGGDGINIIEAGRVERVQAVSNGGKGIRVFEGVIESSRAQVNGSDGMEMSRGEVRDVTCVYNLGYGLRIFNGVVEHATASANGLAGVRMFRGSIRNSFLDSNAMTNPEFECDTLCVLSVNLFQQCSPGSCFSGPGLRFQFPAASNLCDGAVCP